MSGGHGIHGVIMGDVATGAEQLCANHEVISPVLDISTLPVNVLLSGRFNSSWKSENISL